MFEFNIVEVLLRLPVLCMALTVHEFSHGYVAYKLGDPTAQKDGRLSFNPLRHIDPIGMICLLLLRFGWAKPVIVNPENLKNPKRDMALISVAGPLSNVIFALFTVIVWYPLSFSVSNVLVSELFTELILLNLVLAVFNMLPIPPLDGSKVWSAFLSDNYYYRFHDVGARYGFIVLIILIWSGATQFLLFPAVTFLSEGMFELARIVFEIYSIAPVPALV